MYLLLLPPGPAYSNIRFNHLWAVMDIQARQHLADWLSEVKLTYSPRFIACKANSQYLRDFPKRGHKVRYSIVQTYLLGALKIHLECFRCPAAIPLYHSCIISHFPNFMG